MATIRQNTKFIPARAGIGTLPKKSPGRQESRRKVVKSAVTHVPTEEMELWWELAQQRASYDRLSEPGRFTLSYSSREPAELGICNRQVQH